MKTAAARAVPVRFFFPEVESRPAGWGRLAELTPNGARLLTLFRLRRGETVRLSFELFREHIEGAPACVAGVAEDVDGYFVAELRFSEDETRRMIAALFRTFAAHEF